ncbi:MAG: hypothetical protein ACKOYJ_10200 [Planctomycetia bacterium]
MNTLVAAGQCAVLVMSSDRYSDLWPVFFENFSRRWPDCPYPVFLGSNTVPYHGHAFVTTLFSGPDRDWSSSARSIVTQIDQPYLVVLLEDLLVTNEVDSPALQRAVDSMTRERARHVQLACRLPVDGVSREGYGVVDPGAPYRVNVCGLWQKQTFLDLLLDGESPWNFEIMGSYRSRYSDGFLRLSEPPLRLLNLVEKGKFLPSALTYCRCHGISLPLNGRGTLGPWEGITSFLTRHWFNMMTRIPWRMRVSVMDALRKVLATY